MRSTEVQFSENLGFKNISIPLKDSRLVITVSFFDGNRKVGWKKLPKKGEPSDAIKNIPNDYRVCSEGCDAWTDGQSNLPCGKCGAMMKPKGEVYG